MARPPPPDLHALVCNRFAWGCFVRDAVRFSYVYGPGADYLRARATPGSGDLLHKGACDTLDEAHQAAEERAAGLRPVYQDFGSVRVLAVAAYLDELAAGRVADGAPARLRLLVP